jgi:hypothetical protein
MVAYLWGATNASGVSMDFSHALVLDHKGAKGDFSRGNLRFVNLRVNSSLKNRSGEYSDDQVMALLTAQPWTLCDFVQEAEIVRASRTGAYIFFVEYLIGGKRYRGVHPDHPIWGPLFSHILVTEYGDPPFNLETSNLMYDLNFDARPRLVGKASRNTHAQGLSTPPSTRLPSLRCSSCALLP